MIRKCVIARTKKQTPGNLDQTQSKSFTYDIISTIYEQDHKKLEEELVELKKLFKSTPKASNMDKIKPKLMEKIQRSESYRNRTLNLDSPTSPFCHSRPTTTRFRAIELSPLSSTRGFVNAVPKSSPCLHGTTKNVSRSFVLPNKFAELSSTLSEKKKTPRKVRKGLIKLDRVFAQKTRDKARLTPIEKKMKLSILMEEYKLKRQNRTQDLLRGIETTNPATIPTIYDYKLETVLSQERESYDVIKGFRKMMLDPKREVAKIDRNGLLQRKIKRLVTLHRRKVNIT